MIVPLCLICTRYRGDHTCPAFPDGIPAVILDVEWDHRKPFPGDKGLQFDARTDTDSQAVLRSLFGVDEEGES